MQDSIVRRNLFTGVIDHTHHHTKNRTPLQSPGVDDDDEEESLVASS